MSELEKRKATNPTNGESDMNEIDQRKRTALTTDDRADLFEGYGNAATARPFVGDPAVRRRKTSRSALALEQR
jgi:hypothetical protein